MSKIYFRKDSVFKIALRYNVFDQSMEYMQNNTVYAISNPEIIEKISYKKREDLIKLVEYYNRL